MFASPLLNLFQEPASLGSMIKFCSVDRGFMLKTKFTSCSRARTYMSTYVPFRRSSKFYLCYWKLVRFKLFPLISCTRTHKFEWAICTQELSILKKNAKTNLRPCSRIHWHSSHQQSNLAEGLSCNTVNCRKTAEKNPGFAHDDSQAPPPPSYCPIQALVLVYHRVYYLCNVTHLLVFTKPGIKV